MKRLPALLLATLALLAACNSDSSGVVVERPRTAEVMLSGRPWYLSDPAYRGAVQQSFGGLPVAAGSPVTESRGLEILALHAEADSLMDGGRLSFLMDTARAFQRFRSSDPALGQVDDGLTYAALRTALVGVMAYEGSRELEQWVLGARSPAGGLLLAGFFFSTTLPESVPAQMTVLPNGRLVLRVNARLMNENPLRLMPIMAHELAAHRDAQNSAPEELAGSVLEQVLWYHLLTADPTLAQGSTMLPVMDNIRLGVFLQSGTGSGMGLLAANGSMFPHLEGTHPMGATRSYAQFVATLYPGATAASSPGNTALTTFLARHGLQCSGDFSESMVSCLNSEVGRVGAGQLNGFTLDRRLAMMERVKLVFGEGGGGGPAPR